MLSEKEIEEISKKANMPVEEVKKSYKETFKLIGQKSLVNLDNHTHSPDAMFYGMGVNAFI